MTTSGNKPEAGLPLVGVRVLDLSRIIAGPMATQILADCGADVIKVEAPTLGDPARAYTSQRAGDQRSPLFLTLNRNKRSVVIDLKTTEGAEAARRMARVVDVLVHNFRPDVMPRFGMGAEDLLASNPRLVVCEISGFGDVGPCRDWAANDVVAQAHSGIMSYTGEVGGRQLRAGPSIADMSTALYAAIAIMMALYRRQSSGIGSIVRTSLYESALSLVAPQLAEYWLSETVPRPMGNGTSMGLPNDSFPTKGGPVLIAAVDESVWRRLCAVLGVPDMADDPRFRTLPDRRAHRAELTEAIAELTIRQDRDDCVRRLQSCGVPCAPVNDLADVAGDPQFASLAMTAEVTPGVALAETLVRLPFRMSGCDTRVRMPPPKLGEHTDEVFAELGIGFGRTTPDKT
jgi:crotonobetainyl-CoA:carnitine CoA-transferase CaiB-like acyl-CoA transferase